MSTYLLEEFQQKKKNIINLTEKAFTNGWIDEKRKNEIIEKINTDKLTIGVIGQMKCGKSTFLNAFVFGKNILPAATTPMTAALSVITYGPKEKIVAEFYNKDEWEEQKYQASRSLDEVGNNLEESKIKAAKELVNKSQSLSSLNSYLGTTREDSLSNLINYVGADGKFVSITKSVTIYYPEDYLKGVDIVDTPGFNDPIVSREERTKDFLRKADAVLLLLYAGRAFDATDRDILFKNVRQCGSGRVLIGVNKYDIPFANGEGEDVIIKNVCESLEKACDETDDSTMAELLKETKPITLSANMALMSKISMAEIMGNEAFKHAWKLACDNFEISSQKEMEEKSHIGNLTEAIKNVIENEKYKILLEKPYNAIKAAAQKCKEDKEIKIAETKLLIDNLNRPDDELEEQQTRLEKANRRLTKLITKLGDDIQDALKSIVKHGKDNLENDVFSTCDKIDRIIEDKKRFQSVENHLKHRIDKEITSLYKTLERHTTGIGDDAKNKLMNCINEFCIDAEEKLARHLDDFDSNSLISSLKNELSFEISNKSLFKDTEFANYFHYNFDFLDTHNEIKRDLHSYVNQFRKDFDASSFLNTIFDRKDEIIKITKNKIIGEVLNPLSEQIKKIQTSTESKEVQRKNAKDELEKLKADLQIIISSIQEANLTL